ncbi:MAG: hypothetical protein QOE63_584 [Acidimicrobiaceae bacterium]
MRRRLIVVLAAVIPLAALVIAVAIAGGGGSSSPRKLPVAYATSGGSTMSAAQAADAARPANHPYAGIVYKAADDLPDLGGEAPAYQVVSDVTDARIKALADALGVTGDPTEQQKGDVLVGDGGRQLSVDRTTGLWYLSATVASDVAVSSGSGYACPGVAPGEPTPSCPPPDLPSPTTTIVTPPANLPSSDDAKAKALDLLRAAGMDVDQAQVKVDDYGTEQQVTVDPAVDGRSTQGFGGTVAIGDGGRIDYATGYIPHATKADTYPLLTTRQAIEQLNKNSVVPMMGTAVDGSANTGGVAACEETKATTGGGAEVQLPCAPTTAVASTDTATCGAIIVQPDGSETKPCASLPVPTTPPDEPTTTFAPQVVTLTSATLGLILEPTYDGTSAYLVPAYAFTVDDGSNLTTMAIDQSWFASPDNSASSTGSAEPRSVDPASPAVPPGAIETPCTTLSGMSDVGPCYIVPDSGSAGSGGAPAPNTATTVP